ncbi:hypothetical protein QQP08_017164 [Theobroma cacao]|nr:hypothetical protein QQP08_017164 [Theobroma cacao]
MGVNSSQTGDFNIIKNVSEDSDYDGSQVPGSDIKDFQPCLLQLQDIHFYIKLLGIIDDEVESCSVDEAKAILKTSFYDESRNILQAPITQEEVKSTTFSLNGSKAHGPGGYTAQFFRAAWSTVADDASSHKFYHY